MPSGVIIKAKVSIVKVCIFELAVHGTAIRNYDNKTSNFN